MIRLEGARCKAKNLPQGRRFSLFFSRVRVKRAMSTEDTAQLAIRPLDEVTRPDLHDTDAGDARATPASDATELRELAELLETEAAAATTAARRADCHWALGRLLAERLGDATGAVGAFRAALSHD